MGKRETGLTLVELAIYIAVLAGVAIFAATQFGAITSAGQMERAYSEVARVKGAAEAYRAAPAQRGSFIGITVAALANGGYNVEPFTTGTNQNTYGLNVVVAPGGTPNGSDATITYTTGAAADCEQLIDRFTNTAGVRGAPTCAGAVLTLTVE